MKTWITPAVVALVLAAAPVLAQQKPAPKGEKEKQIIITKRVIEPDGTETIETIVKKGPGAEKFDIEAYRRSQGSDSVRIEVRVIETPLPEVREQLDEVLRRLEEVDWKAIGEELGREVEEVGKELERIFDPEEGEVGRVLRDLEGRPRPRTQGYLGVSPLEGDDPKTQGVPIDVLPGTAAERAGLKKGDILLSIDDHPLHNWEELERLMKKTQPGQRIPIRYQRGRKDHILVVPLDSKIVDAPAERRKPRVQVEVNRFREKEACLGVYTSSYLEVGAPNTVRGANITSFTARSAARDAGMKEGDIITAINTKTVKDHDELWDVIAGYKPGDRVTVYYLRNGKPQQVEVSLQPCRDRSTVAPPVRPGEKRPPIVLRNPTDGDIPQISPLPEAVAGHLLVLEGFRAYPNPTTGLVTVEFRTAPKPTTVLLLDLSGRQLFREELNAFSGQYHQQFDLKEFAKGTLLLVVQQGDRLFTERIVLQ
ncbi:MAG: PDZ domain-containing protein [Saprospiraceae bacterium]|nr:PDZ domain-containing protein [Saprospiraceae bacterium]MDW8230264.1 PDZ domain-containing protein [Saprospiraceae bacterium]